MIELTRGNLLQADAEALVNTVNCVGVMGKGVALQFRQAYPVNYDVYRQACKRGEVQPGRMLIWETGCLQNPRYIINFPTKRHWKGKSKIPDIESGLSALVEEVRSLQIRSIALPPLGCGHGGLEWTEVRPLIEWAMNQLPDVRVLLFEPGGTPAPEKMPVSTDWPQLTPARAVLLLLIEQYGVSGYKLGKLEVQKLAYFLQSAGRPLKLTFVPHLYGPYAEALNHVLQRLEGHYLRGYGDRDRHSAIRLLPGAAEQAREFVRHSDDNRTQEHLDRVASLIEGYETPYGLELLATVHWVVTHHPECAADPQDVVRLVHDWSDPKSQLFQPQHVYRAWTRLVQQGWIAPPAGTRAARLYR